MFGCLLGLGAVTVETSCHMGELADSYTDLTGLLGAALYHAKNPIATRAGLGSTL
jgi:hypothetical protein